MSSEPKPPIGIMPAHIWKEKTRQTRINDLLAAMYRYSIADRLIDVTWINELAELVNDANLSVPVPANLTFKFGPEAALEIAHKLATELNSHCLIDEKQFQRVRCFLAELLKGVTVKE